MSTYVLDVPRFDSSEPGNARLDRFVIFAKVGDDEAVSVQSVLDEDGEEDLERWMVAERLALYEEVRKADRNWRALTAALGRPDCAPGRVA